MTELEGFQIEFDEAAIDDLRARLARTRWPERETVDDWSQGVPSGYLQELCEYWSDGYDFAAAQTRLNAFQHFRTDVEGLGIHFLHVRSPHPDAIPLVMTHGWPGTFVEFLEVLEPLANPDDPRDAFHVVVPSLPGFGFSDRPASPGWNLTGRLARGTRSWPALVTSASGRRVATGARC